MGSILNIGKVNTYDQFIKRFNALDTNKDGKITKEDKTLSDEEIGKYDQNIDNGLDQLEVMKALKMNLSNLNIKIISGKIEFAQLSEDVEIQRIKCKRGTEIKYYSSGKLAQATLAEDQKIHAGVYYLIECKKGELIELCENGDLRSTTLVKEKNIGLLKFKAGTDFRYDNCIGLDYAINTATNAILDEDNKMPGIKCKAGTKVEFDNDWLTCRITLAEDAKIQGINCKRETDVRFGFWDGKLDYATLANDQEIQGVNCKGMTEVAFYNHCIYGKGGKLSYATLAKDAKIQGIRFKAGTKVSFNTNGKLIP